MRSAVGSTVGSIVGSIVDSSLDTTDQLHNNICAPGKKGQGNSCFNRTEQDMITKTLGVDTWDHAVTKTGCDLADEQNVCIAEWAQHNDDAIIQNIGMMSVKPLKKDPKKADLHTDDLDKVMFQWSHALQNMVFLGAVSLDFIKYPPFHTFDIHAYPQRFVTMIINLSVRDKAGTHWVALLFDSHERTVFYFDSFAKRIPRPIKHALRLWTPDWTLKQNKQVYQTKTSRDCGLYCCWFLITFAQHGYEHLLHHPDLTRWKKKLFRLK
jgi:hypothetical protein